VEVLAGIETGIVFLEDAPHPTPRESSHSLEAGVLAVVTLLLAPLLIASNNDPHPLYLSLGSWLTLLSLAAGLYVIVVVAQLGAGLLGFGGSWRMLIELLCFFVVLTCFAFPLTGITELVEPVQIPVNTSNLVIVISLSVVLLFALQRWESRVRFGLVAYILGNVVVIALAFLTDTSIDAGRPITLSPEQNVVVLSFDGLSGSAVNEVLMSDDALAEELGGFVAFDSVASSSPATSASIAAELSGNTNFKEVAATTAELWQAAPQGLLTNVLIDHGFRVTTYGVYGKSLDERGTQIRGSVLPGSAAAETLQLAFSRTLSPALAGQGPFRAAVKFLADGSAPESNRSPLIEQIRLSVSPSWDKTLTMSAVDFESLMAGLRVGRAQPAAMFLHFTHTHFPVEWGSSCEFLGNDPAWFSQHQNYSGVIEESTCALRQLGQFLSKLDDLGVLDRSLVVLKSDHGKPVPYAQEGTIESVTINDHALWGLSRYAPFLAVRRPGATGDLRLDSSAVMLDDLARTICQEAEIDYDCTRYPGYNILTESHMIDPAMQVTAFVVQSAASAHRFDEHQAITFPRGDNVLVSLYEALFATGMADEVPTEVLSFP